MEVLLAITKGIAKPNAWGQAIIKTVTIRSNASDKSFVAINQPINANTPTNKAI